MPWVPVPSCPVQGNGFYVSEEQLVDTACVYCHRKGGGKTMMLCARCNSGCHVKCHRPRLKRVPYGPYICLACRPVSKGVCACCGGLNGGRGHGAVRGGRRGGRQQGRCRGDGLYSDDDEDYRPHRA